MLTTLDKFALATLVIPTMFFIFWPVSFLLYQWKGGTWEFRRRTTGYFAGSSFIASLQPGAAAILAARFLPLPSIAGYVFGGMLLVVGLVAGGFTLHRFMFLTAVISYTEPSRFTPRPVPRPTRRSPRREG
jgi:hypothetical protein